MIFITVFSFWKTVSGFLAHRSWPPTLEVDVPGFISLFRSQVTFSERPTLVTRSKQPLCLHPLQSYLLTQ